MVAVEDAVHLKHASSLPEIDVGTHSIASTPLMNNNEAESLDIGQVGVIKVLVDKANGLGGKALGSLSRASIASNQGGRAPIEEACVS